MHRLRLQFPYRGQHVQRAEFTLFTLGIITVLTVVYLFVEVSQEVNHWNLRVERLEQQQKPKATHRARSSSRNREREIGQEIRKEITKANTILEEINLPWEALFDSIENAINEDVALLTIQPNVSNQTVRIGGEARNMSVLLDFVEALERELIFKNAHLLSYKVKQDNQYKPINFLLTATWIKSA